MILVRSVFQAKYGKGDELVKLLKEAREEMVPEYWERILTDASGPFFTVVTETSADSLADWERQRAEIFSQPKFGDWFARMTPLVESGRRDFYNIEG